MKRKDIFLASIDCTVEQAYYIEEGYLDVAIIQNPHLMGYYAMETVVKHLNGEPVLKKQTMETYVVDTTTLFSEEYQRLIFPFD